MATVRDRFDVLAREPGRIGSHRGPVVRGGGWIGLILFLVGLVVITATGLFVVDRYLRSTSETGKGLDFNFPFLPQLVPEPTPTESVAPPVVTNDPAQAIARGLRIMVLNGTPVVGLQTTVSDQLTAAGWQLVPGAVASDRDVLDTFVYYVDPANADIARGLVQALGVGEAKAIAPNVYPDRDIVIILGADHPAVPQPEPSGAPAG